MLERGPDDVAASPRRPAATPMADALSVGSARTRCQFQALPLSNGGSLQSSAHESRYHRLFGTAYLQAESLFVGTAFDSFFFPETVIRESENLAAEAFGAQGAMFVTTGTTVSNQIALLALAEPGIRVLADRSCHQSIHFSLHAANARIDYISSSYECEITARSWFSLDELVGRMWSAQERGEPYDLLVLNGSSYDGVVYRLQAILRALAGRGVRLESLLVDEAWGSAQYFHPALRECTAMAAAVQDHATTNVVATHSVHKSMSCLRQGSMILWRGGADLERRLRNARFRLHTTSPSYPILASIDLARAQMVEEGEALMIGAQALAEDFERRIEVGRRTSRLAINRTPLPHSATDHVMLDPTKVSVNVCGLGRSPDEIKQVLHDRYGVWIRRSTARSILFNMHIGIRAKDIAAVDSALGDLQDEWVSPDEDTTDVADTTSPHFVIPYPPGIPILMPGDPLTAAAQTKIAAAHAAGAHVFTIC